MKNIILIGMPGSGKSTVGVILAKALGMKFVDTDLLIQESEGRLLQQIIDENGVERFLEIEEQELLGIKCKNTVIATGGSAVYSEKAMESLKSSGKVIFLNVGIDALIKRIKNMKTRGIVLDSGRTFNEIYEQRMPLYKKFADKIVECGGLDTEAAVEEIIKSVTKEILMQ